MHLVKGAAGVFLFSRFRSSQVECIPWWNSQVTFSQKNLLSWIGRTSWLIHKNGIFLSLVQAPKVERCKPVLAEKIAFVALLFLGFVTPLTATCPRPLCLRWRLWVEGWPGPPVGMWAPLLGAGAWGGADRQGLAC